MDEKKAIERCTVDAFLEYYNNEFGTSYQIVEHSDNPDIRCQNCKGNKLNIEVTMTEDRAGDIPAVLGRSDARCINTIEVNQKIKRDCRKDPPVYLKYHQSNSLCMVANRIKKKMMNDYGKHTALVVRDVSGVDWDWDVFSGDLRNLLDLESNPFDSGIWVVPLGKDRIFRVV